MVFEEAAKGTRLWYEARVRRAQALIRLKKHQAARELLRSAVARLPHDGEALVALHLGCELVDAYLAQAEHVRRDKAKLQAVVKDGLEQVDTLLQGKTGEAESWLHFRRCFFLTLAGRDDEASEAFKKIPRTKDKELRRYQQWGRYMLHLRKKGLRKIHWGFR